ncbi:ras guanine nucleotide exchange factor domain-containing protein [Catenaria anguillulae PL171]|uniref:Ras guanine nucleotide exchange factor domain-containing protein n=1 Tax=Catenaria anguillulae PL171 TaxID=765915 RepID=A0A1Y2HFN7_9FUNG|nr:ras guanine nucleotide exchange factor domain-containing protein [Catenaria anguillulae PL171]
MAAADTSLPPIVAVVEALFDYAAQEPNCIDIRKGDILYVLEKHETGWWEGINPNAIDHVNARGWFPSNFVQPLPTPPLPTSLVGAPPNASSSPSAASDRPQPTVDTSVASAGKKGDDQTEVISPLQAAAATAHLPKEATLRKRDRPQSIVPISAASSPVLVNAPVNLSGRMEGIAEVGTSNQSVYSSAPMLSLNKPAAVSTDAHKGESIPADQLPPNWRARTTPDGQVYYYNILTNETKWSMGSEPSLSESTDEGEFRKRKDSSLLSSMTLASPHVANSDPSAAANAALQKASSRDNIQAGGAPTWEMLISAIIHTISDLNTSAKANEKPKFVPLTQNIVQAVHDMLLASGTTSKSSRPLQNNIQLKSYHHQLLSAVAKLMLAARVASGVWPPPDAANKMRNQAGQVLLAIRHFVSVAQADPSIKLVAFDKASLASAGGNSTSGSHDEFSQSSTHLTDAALVARLDKEGASISAHLAGVLANLAVGGTSPGPVQAEVMTKDTAMAALVNDYRAKRDNLYALVNDLVTAYLLSASAGVHKGVSETITAAKLVLEEKAAAMSLNFLPLANMPPSGSMSSINSNHGGWSHLGSNAGGTSSSQSHTGVPAAKAGGGLDVGEDDKRTRRVTADFKMRSPGSGTLQSSGSSSSLDSSKLTKFFGADQAVLSRSAATTSNSRVKKKWFLEYDYGHGDITFNMEGQVSGGTIAALVERLTLHDTTIDPTFLQAFLLTFRCFTTPKELLNQLEHRFSLTMPEGLSKEEEEEWQNKKQTPIRLRVFNVLKLWLDNYYVDAQTTQASIGIGHAASGYRYDRHAHGTKSSACSSSGPHYVVGKPLIQLVLRTSSSMGGSASPPPPIVPRSFPVKSFTDIDPLELARQLTVRESQLLMAIQSYELLNQDFSKKNQPVALHVKAMVNFSTQLSSWVAESILLEADAKKRCVVVKYWIKVAELIAFHCWRTRLVHHRPPAQDMDIAIRQYQTLLTKLRKATDHARNYADYRALLKTIQLINFQKYFATAKVIIELLRFQVPVVLVEVPEIQDLINEQARASKTKGNPDELYRMSLILEPRAPGGNGPPPPSTD